MFAMINDLVIQTIATNAFWLVLIVVLLLTFRKQISYLLGSVASFKVAGASFELKDKKATLEYYAILTNILIEILSQRNSADQLVGLLSNQSVQQLTKFSIKYLKEVPPEEQDNELLKNVALIMGRWGQTDAAISFYERLLKQKPTDQDLLNLKGNALLDSGAREHIAAAEEIYCGLIDRYPRNTFYWFNRALARSWLGKIPEALNDLTEAVNLGLKAQLAHALDRPFLAPLERAMPNEFAQLRAA